VGKLRTDEPDLIVPRSTSMKDDVVPVQSYKLPTLFD